LCSFLSDHEPEYLHSEIQVASKIHRFAGTLDGVVMMGGKRVLLDAKTQEKGNVYAPALVQLAGYEIGLKESYAESVERKVIVSLSAEGKYRIVDSELGEADFLACKALYETNLKAQRQIRAA